MAELLRQVALLAVGPVLARLAARVTPASRRIAEVGLAAIFGVQWVCWSVALVPWIDERTIEARLWRDEQPTTVLVLAWVTILLGAHANYRTLFRLKDRWTEGLPPSAWR